MSIKVLFRTLLVVWVLVSYISIVQHIRGLPSNNLTTVQLITDESEQHFKCKHSRPLVGESRPGSQFMQNASSIPIYWINLDRSTDRKEAMLKQFRRLGIKDERRISAVEIPSLIERLQNKTLRFHPNITFDYPSQIPKGERRPSGIFEYPETSCTVSHLDLIHRAYNDGRDIVLVLEDDARLSDIAAHNLQSVIEEAPRDWTVLQLYTSNPTIVAQHQRLADPFTTWFPTHWTTTSYVINRKGMENVLQHRRVNPETGIEGWAFTELKIVVPDEVIYFAAAPGVYTSTKVFIDTFPFESTLQRNVDFDDRTPAIDNTALQQQLQRKVDKLPQSLLVLMTVRVHTKNDVLRELEKIRTDSETVCQHHDTCHWEIEFVLVEASLLDLYETSICAFPDNIHFYGRVDSEQYNKFRHVRRFIQKMADYDEVVLKDADIRIAGFPWVTFLERKEDAVMASSLRQATNNALFFYQVAAFYEANFWSYDYESNWAHVFFSGVRPIDVPLLEMFFVVMDGAFAHYYFDLILNHKQTKEFIHDRSDWGPDKMWCAAAQSWAPNRPGCRLVPVVAHHEDPPQIDKLQSDYRQEGKAALNLWKSVSQFERWMSKSWLWVSILRHRSMHEVTMVCDEFLKRNGYRGTSLIQNGTVYDMQVCASMIIETNCPRTMHATWKNEYSPIFREVLRSLCRVSGYDMNFAWKPELF